MSNETTNAVDVQLLATETLLKPISTEGVRWLTAGDLPLIQAYWWADVEPWTLEEWCDLAAQGYRYCGLIIDGKLVSMCGVEERNATEWEVIAVGTRPDCRRRGYARQVVAFAAQSIVAAGRVATYTARSTNVASQRTAEAVGFIRRSEEKEGGKSINRNSE
ncbi:GNAT family N-acetyltransferase [Candidatus Poribacteria bacterium]|nr:GNAT family N-acetyltransferase [Candidatus Poribacteria bacterium]